MQTFDNHHPQNDTIAAIATAWGEASIAVVRLSGSDSSTLARKVLRFDCAPSFVPRVMHLAWLVDDAGNAIDQVLAVYFAAPRSYTGEDVVEIHTHGGTLVAQLCLEELLRAGARSAEPGEFTQRAFLNGRMDLAQAEAVLGTIRGRSKEALRSAMRTLSGELSRAAREISDEILALRATLEVDLDFPEGEVPQLSEEALDNTLCTLELALQDLLDRCSLGLLLRDGVRVVLTGRPNVGKSSLLNALLQQARAIVTAIPGTTRDVIEETLSFRGVPIRLVDTAGLRAPSDAIEAEGIDRAHEELRRADVCLWVVDGTNPLCEEDHTYLQRFISSDTPFAEGNALIVLNKCDKPFALSEDDLKEICPDCTVLAVSAKTGEGLEALKEAILSTMGADRPMDVGLNVSARQLQHLERSLSAVSEARSAVPVGLDVVAGLLGEAWRELAVLLGIESDDALLSTIFSQFCVGK